MHLSRKLTRVVLSTAALALLATGSLFAADDAQTSASAKKSARRLPAHYGQVVSPDQRAKIYEIQQSYAARIAELEEKLAALKAESDGAMRAVLSSDQLKKLDELVAAAKAKRESRKKENDTAKAAADTGKPARAPVAAAAGR